MSRQAKIIIFSIILIFSIYQTQTKDGDFFSGLEFEKPNKIDTPKRKNKKPKVSNEYNSNKIVEIPTVVWQSNPKNGYSPYNAYFGKGIYNNNSNNSFKIENSNKTDAVVLLVNAYNGRKIRNEFVRKGTTFKMTGVPNGTYYLEWFSGTDWWDDLKVGSKFKGGFQTKASFTKTRDRNDWMKVDGNLIWTVTLYSVVGGDVESESINANDFFN